MERGYLYDESCFYLYRAMTVNPDGEVAPCCALYHSKFDFGNLIESSLEDVWNGGHYRASRALFSRENYDGQLKTACHECPLFKSRFLRTFLGSDGGAVSLDRIHFEQSTLELLRRDRRAPTMEYAL